jgi:hypothetical protein
MREPDYHETYYAARCLSTSLQSCPFWVCKYDFSFSRPVTTVCGSAFSNNIIAWAANSATEADDSRAEAAESERAALVSGTGDGDVMTAYSNNLDLSRTDQPCLSVVEEVKDSKEWEGDDDDVK